MRVRAEGELVANEVPGGLHRDGVVPPLGAAWRRVAIRGHAAPHARNDGAPKARILSLDVEREAGPVSVLGAVSLGDPGSFHRVGAGDALAEELSRLHGRAFEAS